MCHRPRGKRTSPRHEVRWWQTGGPHSGLSPPKAHGCARGLGWGGASPPRREVGKIHGLLNTERTRECTGAHTHVRTHTCAHTKPRLHTRSPQTLAHGCHQGWPAAMLLSQGSVPC